MSAKQDHRFLAKEMERVEADYKAKQEQEERQRKQQHQKAVILRVFLVIIGLALAAGAYVFRDEVGKTLSSLTGNKPVEEGAEPADGDGQKEKSGIKRTLNTVNYAAENAEKRDSVLDEIYQDQKKED